MKGSILTKSEIQSIQNWLSKMNQPYVRQRTRRAKIRLAVRVLGLRYKKIGNGYNRIVFDLEDGFVLKIPIKEKGKKDNHREFIIFNSCPQDLKPHLALVKDWGKNWLVMKKVDKKVPINTSYNQKVKALKTKFYRKQILARDLSRRNIRLGENGEIIVIDYGNFKFKKRILKK